MPEAGAPPDVNSAAATDPAAPLDPDGLVQRVARAVLPVAVRRAIRRAIPQQRRWWERQVWRARLAWIRRAALWRLEPVRRDFGWLYGQCIDRYYIEDFLGRHAADIRGRVLEIQNNQYTTRFGATRVTRSDVLHVTADNPRASIVADLTNAGHLESEMFDCIILTQTLQFIYDVRAALRTAYRILKPGGVLLATVPGISQIARYDMQHWGEYWRFTTLSVRKLFSELVPAGAITVHAYGNVLSALGFLHGLVATELSRTELEYHDPDYELLIAVRIAKPSGPVRAVDAVATIPGRSA